MRVEWVRAGWVRAELRLGLRSLDYIFVRHK